MVQETDWRCPGYTQARRNMSCIAMREPATRRLLALCTGKPGVAWRTPGRAAASRGVASPLFFLAIHQRHFRARLRRSRRCRGRDS
eukprot:scaffold271178_cov31-Tisochrysis_lutea.AAC.2